ncbi:hypothetical protein [Cupriavidus basilensis]|uniref:hypothetical protein n=1 Tax=Cupriavidus basilensis TaxID=68895 RepID=UPI0005BBF6CC|nr:hypothetical protein [Cupriavidus basilensis]
MTADINRYAKIEKLLRDALDQVGSALSDRDKADVSEYLDYGEYGVAYELLTFLLDKQQIAHPKELRQAGGEMGLLE